VCWGFGVTWQGRTFEKKGGWLFVHEDCVYYMYERFRNGVWWAVDYVVLSLNPVAQLLARKRESDCSWEEELFLVVNGDGAFPLGRDPPAQAVLFLDRFMIIEEMDQIVMQVFFQNGGAKNDSQTLWMGEELTLCVPREDGLTA
jgi:hypothetical protein